MNVTVPGIVFLFLISLTVAASSCSHSSGKSGEPTRQSAPERQATLLALSALKASASNIQSNIMQLSAQDLNDYPALTGLLLTASLAQGLDLSNIGNSPGGNPLTGDQDADALAFVVMMSIANEGRLDLKSQLLTLEEFRKRNAALMGFADKFSDDFDSALAAISSEGQALIRKQESGGPADSTPVHSTGIFHLSGRSDRSGAGGKEDWSPLISYDARTGEFLAELRCSGSMSQFFVQIIDVWSGLELARVASVAGLAQAQLILSQRTAVGVRAIARDLPYTTSTQCNLNVDYHRRQGAKTVSYSAPELGPLFDSVSKITNETANLNDELNRLWSDKVLSPDDVEAILEQQDLYNTLATMTLPSSANPFGNLESVGLIVGNTDDWSLDSQKKLQDLMSARAKLVQQLSNLVVKLNNSRGSLISSLK